MLSLGLAVSGLRSRWTTFAGSFVAVATGWGCW